MTLMKTRMTLYTYCWVTSDFRNEIRHSSCSFDIVNYIFDFFMNEMRRSGFNFTFLFACVEY